MAEIRRQGETHDPQRVHQVSGPATTRNQVRSIGLRIDALEGGKLRLSTPYARGWARTVRTRDELAAAVAEAFREVQVASYAQWRGEAYDLDVLTPVDNTDPMTAAAPHVRQNLRQDRNDVHDPRDWTPLPDGRWRAPGGKVYGAETDAVRRVVAKRRRAGLD